MYLPKKQLTVTMAMIKGWWVMIENMNHNEAILEQLNILSPTITNNKVDKSLPIRSKSHTVCILRTGFCSHTWLGLPCNTKLVYEVIFDTKCGKINLQNVIMNKLGLK